MSAFSRLCALATILASCCFSNVAHGQELMFRSNAAHTGVFSASGAPEFHKLKWKFRTKGVILSSPVVSGGIVYNGNAAPNFYALYFSTGCLNLGIEKLE